MKKFFSTGNDLTGPILRLSACIVMWPHGAQKLAGWFGGFGFSGTMDFFTGTMHLPCLVGLLVILLEFFGPLLLLAGIAVRFVSATMVVLVLGILFTSHLDNGFFMNWFGTAKGEGYEFDLLYIGICLALIANGAGRWSVDCRIAHQRLISMPGSQK
jgi:putative oxidoreductase